MWIYVVIFVGFIIVEGGFFTPINVRPDLI